jgi:hypothetical protein
MLLKRARIEAYFPEKNVKVYGRLLRAIEAEFLFTFGGCTIIDNIKGLYLLSGEKPDEDKITLVYADMPFGLDENFQAVSDYADAVRNAAAEALPEQSILVAVHEVYHSIQS